MQDFASRYYDVPEAEDVKMTFGLPVATLAMMAPVQFNNLMGLQKQNCSLMEMLGGGYYYVDTYSQDHNRKTNLRVAACCIASSSVFANKQNAWRFLCVNIRSSYWE